jgi:ABC-type lipoprotein release transport system permease subunit
VNTIGELHRMVHQSITSLLHLAYLLVFICLLVLVLSVYSSISLDAATRQKEIAVRKINGARKKDILKHFILPYVTTYLVTFIIVYPLLCCLMYWATQGGAKMQRSLIEYYCPYGVFILVVTLGLLLLTTWHKIKLIMKVNPADVIRRE